MLKMENNFSQQLAAYEQRKKEMRWFFFMLEMKQTDRGRKTAIWKFSLQNCRHIKLTNQHQNQNTHPSWAFNLISHRAVYSTLSKGEEGEIWVVTDLTKNNPFLSRDQILLSNISNTLLAEIKPIISWNSAISSFFSSQWKLIDREFNFRSQCSAIGPFGSDAILKSFENQLLKEVSLPCV